MLKTMMIDFNEGIIIQMNLQEKVSLKNKIKEALDSRQNIKSDEELDNQSKSALKAIKFNLSENDVQLEKSDLSNKSMISRSKHDKISNIGTNMSKI